MSDRNKLLPALYFMKNALFWYVTLCGSLRTNVSEECINSINGMEGISELGTMLAVTS
jgi:hypothetical protein